MSQTRHFRQRWDPAAPLKFRKRMVLLGATEPVLPGEPLTPEMREALGKHRVKIWWDAGIFELDLDQPGEQLLVPETGLPAETCKEVRRALARRGIAKIAPTQPAQAPAVADERVEA